MSEETEQKILGLLDVISVELATVRRDIAELATRAELKIGIKGLQTELRDARRERR